MTDAIVKFEDTMNIAKAMASSGFFQDSADASKAVVKILAGQEIGIGPFASMTGIHIIKGKPVMGANVVATIIENDPRYDYRVIKLENDGCIIDFYQHGKKIGTTSFLEADAKAAGLFGKDNWKKFPRNMYFARAISNGARWYTPGVFGGAPVYTPDEFDLDVDEDGGVVIESVTTDVQEPETIIKELGYDQFDKEPEPVKAKKARKVEEPKKKNGDRPYPPVVVRMKLAERADKHVAFETTSAQQKALRMALINVFAGDDEAEDKRHTLLQYLLDDPSTKNKTGEMFKAIYEDWLKVKQDADGQYHVDPLSIKEAQAVVTEALKSEGQQELI